MTEQEEAFIFEVERLDYPCTPQDWRTREYFGFELRSSNRRRKFGVTFDCVPDGADGVTTTLYVSPKADPYWLDFAGKNAIEESCGLDDGTRSFYLLDHYDMYDAIEAVQEYVACYDIALGERFIAEELATAQRKRERAEKQRAKAEARGAYISDKTRRNMERAAYHVLEHMGLIQLVKEKLNEAA